MKAEEEITNQRSSHRSWIELHGTSDFQFLEKKNFVKNLRNVRLYIPFFCNKPIPMEKHQVHAR